MAKSPRKHTLCTPLSIDQLFIFGIFEHNWEHESTLTTSKKYSWCIPVQKEIKPIIWGAAITPEPWNRQQCWFIFEDPNVRVARLLESLATMKWRQRNCSKNVNNKRPFGTCFRLLTSPTWSHWLQIAPKLFLTPCRDYDWLVCTL